MLSLKFSGSLVLRAGTGSTQDLVRNAGSTESETEAGPARCSQAPQGSLDACQSVRTIVLAGGWMEPSPFQLAPVSGTVTTSSPSTPFPHHPDSSGGPDLSESPWCAGGGGRGLGEWRCSDKRVSAVSPHPLLAGLTTHSWSFAEE